MSTGTQRSSRLGAPLLVLAVLISFLVPVAVQAAPAGTYSASSSATLLNLQLFAVPGAPALTIGQASSELSSSPLSAKGAGTGVICPAVAQCATATSQSASAPPDSDPSATQLPVTLPAPLGPPNNIVSLTSGFGDAAAGTASGDPVGVGTSGVSTLAASLKIGSLNTQVEGEVQKIAKEIATLLGLVPDTDVAQVDQIKTALNSVLGNVSQARQVLSIKLGTTTAKSLAEGSKVTGRAETVGLKIGLLPICELSSELKETCSPEVAAALDPLTHGLLKIDVTIGLAEAGWDGNSHSLEGTPATAKIEVRDLTKQGVVYLPLAPQLPALPELPTLLTGPLETTVKVASVDKNVSAHTVTVNALEIHALKGLTDPSASSVQQQSNNQGGILLQVGNLKASATGQGPTSVLGLPKTGGMRYVFYTVAALLIVGAPVAYLVSRRLRRTTT
jgi:hypothetical protein